MTTEPAPSTDPELEARWGLVAARYGHRLDAAQRADLRRTVEGLVAAARDLRRVSLANWDAPLEGSPAA